jgi:hypothetical protein
MVGEQRLFDVRVAIAVGPIPEITVLELIAEQCNDSVLGGAFGFAYVVHREPFFETQRLRGHRGWRGWVVRSGFAMPFIYKTLEAFRNKSFVSQGVSIR